MENNFQSAYRKYHSTETALIRVHNDMLCANDAKNEVAIVYLDLTAAFDTISHKILLDRPKNMYGIDSTALQWISSYLSDRQQKVVSSRNQPLTNGVSQGSVIGPKLFTLYIGALSLFLKIHNVDGMMCADDIQLYVSFSSFTRASTIASLEACIADIRFWLIKNKLLLNFDKTEVFHITSRFQNAEPLPPIQIGSSTISAAPTVSDFGIVYDNHLVMSSHVTKVCCAASHALRTIGQLRRFLDGPTIERLVHACISSGIDCCNCLLYVLPANEIDKLQRIQNAAARMVVGAPRFHSIHPILRKLHWLPVRKGILFKLLLVFKSLNDFSPAYINVLLLKPYIPKKMLRSSSLRLLTVPSVASKSCLAYDDRAFSIAAPREWNK